MGGGPKIPHGSPRPHHSHIDTCYLRPILLEQDDDHDLLVAARRLVTRADGRGVCASVAVLGETIIKADAVPTEGGLSADDLEKIGRNLARLIQTGKITLCGLGSNHGSDEFFQRALEVRQADGDIGDLDVLILASAICCEDCTVLYTNDGPMLRSKTLRTLAGRYEVTLQEAPGDRPRGSHPAPRRAGQS